MSKNDAPLPIWRRSGVSMVPANDVARAMAMSLEEGREYLAAWPFHAPRSIQQLRLWWSLCGLMAEHSIFPTQVAASNAIKISCGHFDQVIMPDTGEVHLIPRSIAFQSLPQHEFQEIFTAALNIIVKRWMRGSEAAEIRREAWKRIDGPSAIGERVDRYADN